MGIFWPSLLSILFSFDFLFFQVQMSLDVGVKHRIGYHALVRPVGMSSSLDMFDLLAILGVFDDMESCSSCCTSVCMPAFS